MRRGAVVGGLVVVATACGEAPAPVTPTRAEVASLWELAPHDASSGVVMAEGAPGKLLALITLLDDGPARKKIDEAAKKRGVTPLPTAEGWARSGLDPSMGAAMFAWTDRERGALLVLPVRDRAAFRKAFAATTAVELGRDFDLLPWGDYRCAEIAKRYVCAKRASDVVAAGVRHAAPLVEAWKKLPDDDRGDVEAYADVHQRDVAKLAEGARPLGRVTGVAGSIRLRIDGASARVHVIADELTPLAYAFKGTTPPPAYRVAASNAPSAVHFAIDPLHAFDDDHEMEIETRSELVERLTGEIDMTTSGHGLAGVYGVAPVRAPDRVEAYVKKVCAEQGGSKRSYALRDITVTPHGCSARFDPHMLLLPVSMNPLPLAASVDEPRVVFTVGDATPTDAHAAVHAEALPPPGTEAARELARPQAAVLFTRSPWIGPDVGAGAAFKSLVSLLDEKSTSGIDAFGDLGARIAQALVVARVEDDGVVVAADIVTFAHDPGPASAAYDAALARRSAGEIPAYRAALADVERAYPGTLAAQRARDLREQGPWLGAGAWFFASLGGAAPEEK